MTSSNPAPSALYARRIAGISIQECVVRSSFLIDKKARTEALIAGIREGRKKELIQKHIEMLMEFDEDQLDIAEVLLEILNGMSRVEGIWLMNLVSTAMQLPDILFKEWLEKADHRELFSALKQNKEQVAAEDLETADENKTVEVILEVDADNTDVAAEDFNV